MKQNIGKYLVNIIVILVFFQSAFAQEYKIGLATWSGYPKCVQGFKDSLAKKGIVSGKNVSFVHGDIGANKVLQQQVANNFIGQKVDLVFSLTTPGTTIIKEVIPESIPIVFSIVTYPADSGLIESFEYSGNNLVGTSNYVPLSYSIDLLLTVLPTTKTVAIFHRKGEPNSKIQMANLFRLLKRKNIKVINVQANNLEHLKKEALLLVDKVDVFITTTDTLMQSGGEDILIDISLANGIPILSSNKSGIEKGATFGVVADFYQLGSMAGTMAANILLHNASPESIQSKIQNPPTYLFNKMSMKKLSIIVPKPIAFKVQWTQ